MIMKINEVRYAVKYGINVFGRVMLIPLFYSPSNYILKNKCER